MCLKWSKTVLINYVLTAVKLETPQINKLKHPTQRKGEVAMLYIDL